LIACHCNVVCDSTVMDAISEGATSIEALASICGAGARCGGCHDSLDTLLAAAQAVEEAFGPLVHAGGVRLREAAVG
jgi:bacterioferritin-associated ferredoxin